MYYPNDWVSVLLWGLSAARTTLCAAETVSHPHLHESHHVSHMEAPCFLKAALIINITKGGYGCSLFGIHSNILGSSLLVFLCRALFASFLSRYTLTSIVPTNYLLSCSLSSQVQRVIHTMPCIKHHKICERCPPQVTWKVKFKCQICLSWISWFSCLSRWPWWPWRVWLQW